MELIVNYEVTTREGLSSGERELVVKAIEATGNAYSPYSRFSVGAAVRLANNEVIIGANQENAAYPMTLCAERTAIFAAQAQYPDQAITCIALAAKNEQGLTAQAISPCGACRQVMVEVEKRYGQDMTVLMVSDNNILRFSSARDLLPLCFNDDNLNGA